MIQSEQGETKVENSVIRWFLRALSALILMFYVGYAIFKKWTDGEIKMDAVDWSLVGGAISMLIAVEAVRAYVKRKLEN